MTRRSRPASPLPVRDGVCASRVYLPTGPWRTVLDFLLERYPHLQPEILKFRLERGDIVDAQGRPQALGTAYQPNQWLWYYREVPHETPLPFDLPVIYADDGLVVADKPHFMASTPGGRHLQETALIRLRRTLGLAELSPLHRLDRDTAGVIVFCADPTRRGAYQSLFQRREVHKVYEAVARWRPDLRLPCTHQSCITEGGGVFRMVETSGAANSETRIELITTLTGPLSASHAAYRDARADEIDTAPQAEHYAHYRLLPLTGRKHQLRVHMNALGIPIAHDEMYPDLLPCRRSDDFSRPLQLLARTISFTDPFTGQQRRFDSQRHLTLAMAPPDATPGPRA